MGLLTLDDLRHERLDDGAERLSATATIDGTPHPLSFVGRGAPLSRAVDPFVPIVVLRAMREGHDVRIVPPVSARLLAALPTALDIFCSFERLFRRPAIEASPVVRERAAPGAEIAFFSGGVDSFYTVLKHRETLGALLFVHGFDLALGATALRDMVRGTLREAAGRLALPFVEVETNARPFIEKRDAPGRTGKWTMVQGAVLGGLGLAVAPHFARAYVPSGAAYHALTTWGTHPLIDPLWSTEEVQIVHDGCERTRLQKLEVLAESPLALATLRVCFKNPEGAYNCGTCDKCMRTMIELRAVGALDRCPTFAQPLSLESVRRMPLAPVDRNHVREAARFLAARGRDPELRQALETSLGRARRREVAERVLAAAQTAARSWQARLGLRAAF